MAQPHHHPIPEEGSCGHGDLRSGERRGLLWVIALTAVTMVAEFAGGLLTHSLALLGDAVHMLTHLLALSLSYGAIVLAARPAPSDKTWRCCRRRAMSSTRPGPAGSSPWRSRWGPCSAWARSASW